MCRKLLQPKPLYLLPLPQAFQATIKHKGEEKLVVALESENTSKHETYPN